MLRKIAAVTMFSLGLTACDNNEVGDVSLGLFTLKDIKIENLKDDIVTGVTCHIASVEADFSLADPSDSSISCRQTGDITPEMIAKIDQSNLAKLFLESQKAFSLNL